MRVFIAVLVLILNLQSWTKADDIRDFEIEGMSIGDSLLDYLSKDQIISEIKSNRYMYTRLTDEFGQVYMRDGLSKYHFVSFFVRAKDKNFIIHGITGTMSHVEDISECHKDMNEIANEFSTLFKDAEKVENSYDHGVDKTGRSKIKEIYFILKSENYVRIVCMDFEESLRIKYNWGQGLDVAIDKKEVVEWLDN